MSIKDILKRVKPDAKTTESTNLVLCHIAQDELVEVCTKLHREFSLNLKTIKATDDRKKWRSFYYLLYFWRART
jgi:hypothetical protein